MCEATQVAPLQTVQSMYNKDGPPLSLDRRLCRHEKPQVVHPVSFLRVDALPTAHVLLSLEWRLLLNEIRLVSTTNRRCLLNCIELLRVGSKPLLRILYIRDAG